MILKSFKSLKSPSS